MQLTEEQKAIIATDENIIVKALAGSGKTHTLIEYVKTRQANKRILYLAYNKSVKEEAEHKFKNINHLHIDIRTAHSLAYEFIVKPKKSNIKVGFINSEDVAVFLKIENYILTTHILKFVNCYCNSSEFDLKNLDYKSTLTTDEALIFVDENYDLIIENATRVLSAMKKGYLPMTHDFYLKLYQLSNPILNFDYILFDEGQDASEVMLDIFLKQNKAIKIIVGDTHQQIYAWRNAINSLEKVNFKQYTLSSSFRFGENIADLAIDVVNWKVDLLKDNLNGFKLIGKGKDSKKHKTTALLARTNIKLIDYAIQHSIFKPIYKKIYYEGGFQNYSISNVYMYVNDILALKNGQPKKIKNKRLKNIQTLSDLETFIKETEDVILAQAVKMVQLYGRNLPEYLEKLKFGATEDKSEADIILSTVHRCKGMEYDSVTLLDDFNSKFVLHKIISDNIDNLSNSLKLVREEINILYVAITRAKNKISIPASITADLYSYKENEDKHKKKKHKYI